MFAELAAKTNYSFLEGASHPEEMVHRAHELGYSALGIVDRNGVYGIARAHAAAKAVGLHLLTGTELVIDQTPVIFLAKNRKGYGDLCELITAHHISPLSWSSIFEKSEDLFLLLPCVTLLPDSLSSIKHHFQHRLYLIASHFLDGSQRLYRERAKFLSQEHQIPVLVSNQPLFHAPERKSLHDVLRCIQHICTLKDAGFRLLPNRERHLKDEASLSRLFKSHPEWIANTLKVASECCFSLEEIHYRYPTEWLPPGETADAYLDKLVWEGALQRYGEVLPTKVSTQLQHELSLIHELHYADYFLTIWDILQFARSRSILCQGRGSAANSIVCYVLGITAIDPVRMELLFERFISRERQEPPDIDIDFEHQRREEVIQYIYQRYGRDRAAITAEVICFRRRSAIREVGKVFGIPLPILERLLTLTYRRSLDEVTEEELVSIASEIPLKYLRHYWSHVKAIRGFPRHIGTHVGGFVLCQEKLSRNVPIEKAAMPGRTIIQWDKNDLDNLGFVRVDILGLGIMTALQKSFETLSSVYQKPLSLTSIPPEDPKIYDIICRADTVGVFQIESRAQMNMLPRLKPKNFFDIVVEISLVRPGPIQGEMVHPYLRRRSGKEPIEYPHPDLEAILKKTCGVPIFQEQVMKIAMKVAGFTGGEADELRRAMGTWRHDGTHRLSQMGEKFRVGLIRKGIAPEFAEKIFHQIEGFAEYGFPESHAASFAILAYATAYLKCYYPDVFVTALLNSQPMGFYGPHTLIYDAERHGVTFLPIDVNRSRWDHVLLKSREVQLGLREIHGVGENVCHIIEGLRPFQHFKDFVDRLKDALAPLALTKRNLFYLAGANAFSSLGLNRREAFWEIQGLSLKEPEYFSPEGEITSLPAETPWETISLDYEAQGVSLYDHPMRYLRKELQLPFPSSRELRSLKPNTFTQVAGMVIARQTPPTASGTHFITLEDEEGFMNLIVRKEVLDKYKETLFGHSFLICHGKIQHAEGASVTQLLVDEVSPLL